VGGPKTKKGVYAGPSRSWAGSPTSSLGPADPTLTLAYGLSLGLTAGLKIIKEQFRARNSSKRERVAEQAVLLEQVDFQFLISLWPFADFKPKRENYASGTWKFSWMLSKTL